MSLTPIFLFWFGGDLHYTSSLSKFQWHWIVIFWNFDRRSCKTACRSQINETADLNLNDWRLWLKYQKIWSTTSQLFASLDFDYFWVLHYWEKCVYLIGAQFAQEKEKSIYAIKLRKIHSDVNVCVTRSWKVWIFGFLQSEMPASRMKTVFRGFLPLY